MSGISRVAEETRYVCGIAEAAIAEAKSVHGEVESRVASPAAQAEASMAQVVGTPSEHIKEWQRIPMQKRRASLGMLSSDWKEK